MVLATGFLGSLDDLFRNNFAVGARDCLLLQLAGNTFFNEVPKTKRNLRYFRRRYRGMNIIVAVLGQDWSRVTWSVIAAEERD
jgi:hypothetical protein